MNGQNLNLNKNNIQKIREKENNCIQINSNKNNNNNIHKNTNEIKEALLMENNNIEILNLNAMSEEYDNLILNLREQLSKVKEERKKTENEYNIIKHRLTILKNSEKTNNINFQNIKYRFKKIMNNRLESQKKIRKKNGGNTNINKATYFMNKSVGSKYTYPCPLKMIKKNKSGYNLSHTPKNSLNLCKTYSNFEKKNNFNNNINSFDIDYNLEENKKHKLKQKLIEKLREDEEEKKKIEDEIAKIEKEEFMLLNSFKNDKIYAENNS